MAKTKEQNRNAKLPEPFTDLFLRQFMRVLAPDTTIHDEEPLTKGELIRARVQLSNPKGRRDSDLLVAGVDYGLRFTHLVVIALIPESEMPVLIYSEVIPVDGPQGKPDTWRICEIDDEFGGFDMIVDDINGIGADRHKKVMEHLSGLRRLLGALFDTAAYERFVGYSNPVVGESTVTVSKVTAVTKVIEAIRHCRLLIKGDIPNLGLLQDHLMALSIKAQARGRHSIVQPSVLQVHKEDHFFCAVIYAQLGLWIVQHGS